MTLADYPVSPEGWDDLMPTEQAEWLGLASEADATLVGPALYAKAHELFMVQV